jgi:penicillin amidase
MAKPERSKPPDSRRGFRLWWIGAGLLSLVLLVVALAAAAYLYLRTSLPQLDGELRLAGPEAKIEIVRDRHAVPHIYAANRHDAFFAMGFVHAQDRLWQMEFQRRVAAGRLAEAVGEPGIEVDKFIRTLGIPQATAEVARSLSPAARADYEAYAAGVNAYLITRGGALPLEFMLLGVEPEPWRVEDSLGWAKMMAWDLGGNAWDEALRARMAKLLTTEQIALLFPDYPASAAPAPSAALSAAAPLFAGLNALLPAARQDGLGSNNWVVDGRHTKSGKPLLANDPHLRLTTPSLWYLAHFSAPGLDVIGGTLPGIPAPVLGRNAAIAWGFTNTNPDVQDLYIEKLDAADPKQYLTPEGPRPFVERSEVIRVKDQPEITLSVRETRHGPVISDLIKNASEVVGADQVIAFAWTALQPGDRTAEAGLNVLGARNWDEFRRALRDFTVPQQNIVYADRDGHIGYIAPARVPIRRSDIGWLPADGASGQGDWIAAIPFDALPQTSDPPEGTIVTANNRIVPPDYPYFITRDFSPPYRADRIKELIAATPQHDVESFAAIQHDLRSNGIARLLPLLLATAQTEAPGAQAMLERLKQFDGVMAADRAEPLVVMAWLRELMRGLFADELKETFADYWSIQLAPIESALSGAQGFCDDIATEPKEECAGLVGAALERALADLGRRYGEDPAGWRWGEAHAIAARNRVLSEVPLIGPLFGISLPNGGEKDTVNAGGFVVGNDAAPFAQVHGPGYRAIYDLADPERSVFIQSSGQSGNPFSPYYKDFAERWQSGGYLPMQTLRATVEQGALGTLTLLPR